jgi:ribosome-binding protein aMBF1 (putative translation factor)
MNARKISASRSQGGGFERFVAERMRRKGFAEAHAKAKADIEEVDRLVADLEAARAFDGISKAELARALGMVPSAVRRLLTARGANPGLKTLVVIGRVLGYRLRWEPIARSKAERRR